jgi:hypothetical protein
MGRTGIPHLAKNERDIGYPKFVGGPEFGSNCGFSNNKKTRVQKNVPPPGGTVKETTAYTSS